MVVLAAAVVLELELVGTAVMAGLVLGGGTVVETLPSEPIADELGIAAVVETRRSSVVELTDGTVVVGAVLAVPAGAVLVPAPAGAVLVELVGGSVLAPVVSPADSVVLELASPVVAAERSTLVSVSLVVACEVAARDTAVPATSSSTPDPSPDATRFDSGLVNRKTAPLATTNSTTSANMFRRRRS